MPNTLDSLLEYVQAEGRVCPMPTYWQKLWEMLPGRRQAPSGGWEPSLPLILAAWGNTSAVLKILRVKDHISYAAEKGELDKIDTYLRGLPPEAWAYGDGKTDWEAYKGKH